MTEEQTTPDVSTTEEAISEYAHTGTKYMVMVDRKKKLVYHDGEDAYATPEARAVLIKHYQEFYPILKTKNLPYTIVIPKDPSEPREWVWAKKVGTQGADFRAADVAHALLDVPPQHDGLLRLYRLLEAESEELVELLEQDPDQVNALLLELGDYIRQAKGVAIRCANLPAVASEEPTLI